jgi:hypothetical protein
MENRRDFLGGGAQACLVTMATAAQTMMWATKILVV